MTTEAQRLADALDAPGKDFDCSEVAALLRRQEAALRQAREALERVAEAMPFPVATKTIAAINELLGERT